MPRPILFLKYSYFQTNILTYVKNYLELSEFEFEGLIAGILLTQDTRNKSKVFDYERVINMRYELTGKGDYRRYYGIKLYDELVKQGYFIMIGNKFQGKKTKVELPVYKLNPKKMLYFLSVLNAFMETELKKVWSIEEIQQRKTTKNPLLKKNVLKHKKNVEDIKKMIKI